MAAHNTTALADSQAKHVKLALPTLNPHAKKGTTDSYLIFDSFPDFIKRCQHPDISLPPNPWNESFTGGSYHNAMDGLILGNPKLAKESDAIMSKLESESFPLTKSFETSYQVSGGSVCVPAFLQGVPTHMRMRRRIESPLAPLIVFIDMSSSAGIPVSTLQMRGAALLALVRLLSEKRPVTVHAGMICGSSQNPSAATVLSFPLETSPLDVSRAAHILAGTMVARGLGFAIHYADQNNGEYSGSIGWAYHSVERERLYAHATLARVYSPGKPEDLLYISGAHLDDASLTTPHVWLHDMLAKYGVATGEGVPLEPAE